MKDKFDVVVIGGGAMGLSTASQLAKKNVHTLVLERFGFINQFGSSAGISRQFSILHQQPYMMQMALDAKILWDELQQTTSVQLLDQVGTLWFGDPEVNLAKANLPATEATLKAKQVPYTSLHYREIEEQYHFKNLPTHYIGLFQPDGASIDLKASLETLLKNNRESPYITLQENTPVTGITQAEGVFIIQTQHTQYMAEKLVLTPGPYMNEVTQLLGFGAEVTYWNMASAYFKKTDKYIKFPTWAVFQQPEGNNGNEFYGFPEEDWNYPGFIRVAPNFVTNPLMGPEQRTSVPNKDEIAYTSAWVKTHMQGLDPRPCFQSTCLKALSRTANQEPIIDFAPEFVPNHKNIVIHGTGWIGKLAPLMGKILAELILEGKTSYDISSFKTGSSIFKQMPNFKQS
jgi:glycine/D-amino acid oxidase-like deaminating enzyme